VNIEIGGGQIQGKRELQEDAYGWCWECGGAQAWVCDGIGGEPFGDLAARMVSARILREFIERDQMADPAAELMQIMLAAIEDLRALVRESYKFNRSSTTATILHIANGRAHICSIGDSPVFRVRNSEIVRLTKPMQLGDYDVMGLVGGAEYSLTGLHCMLFNHPVDVPVEPGDQFVVASDGILTLAQPEIADVLYHHFASGPAVNNLLQLIDAKSARRQDNCTVVCLFVP
jgi:PPM family protein phosphatase